MKKRIVYEDEDERSIGQKTGEFLDSSGQKFIDAKKNMETKIKDKPFSSIAISAGVGALVGAAIALALANSMKNEDHS